MTPEARTRAATIDDVPTLPIPLTDIEALDELDVPDGRRRVRIGRAAGAIGALGVVLLGVGAPAVHAATATDAAPRSTGAARAGSVPPAVPAPRAGVTEAITDVWGRGSGTRPRSR